MDEAQQKRKDEDGAAKTVDEAANIASFTLGSSCYRVSMELHKENRDRLVARMRQVKDAPIRAAILLEGGKEEYRHETDHEKLFRQESWFQWLFGVKEPGCFGVIDIENNLSFLFVPRLPESYAVWMGPIQTPKYFAAIYGVDRVFYVDELDSILIERAPQVIYTLNGLNTDSGNCAKPATFEGIQKFNVNQEKLWPEAIECRVIKTPKEIDVIRYAVKVSSDAHKEVMRAVKAGMSEYQLESLFLHHAYFQGGCRNVGYTCISCSGINSAILHYGHAGAPNSRVLKEGEMLLLDMGAEYHCYGADITCSYPVNGKFSDDQKLIYNAVYSANQAVLSKMQPGVEWSAMHILAERVILEKLKEGGLLRGDIDAMVTDEVNIPAVFMPHGLGHLLGIDTHDPGGYPAGITRATRPGLKSLRNGRQLASGMVLTVEPGCYFIKPLLDAALANPLQAPFLVEERINQFRDFGGVRIEDDVVVTDTGVENMTQVPRTVDEIEEWMNQK